MRGRRRTMLEVVVVGMAAAAALAPLPPQAVEAWYSTGFYPYLQQFVTPATNLLPFALLDVLTVAAAMAAALVLAGAVRASWHTRRIVPVLGAVGHLAAAAAVVYLAFLLLWGLNYRRVPLGDRLVQTGEIPTAEAVLALGTDAASRLNALHAEAHASGWPEAVESESLRRAFTRVQQVLGPAPAAEPGRFKATIYGPYFRWAGVDGMVNPFGLEILANPDLLPFERPFVAAHEWAHLAGYADEAEANFIGWLTCIRAGVPEQYSGWLYLYWQVSGELAAPDRETLSQALGDGPRRDLDAIIARLQRGEWRWVRWAGWAAYDQYLRANRVEQGVRSYGAVVSLILRARFEDGWTPVRRDGRAARQAPG